MGDGSAASPGLAFATDTNTGIFTNAADKIGFATGGVERLEIGSSEVVFNDGSNDVDFRVESNGNTHMLFVDSGNARVGIGASAPAAELDVAGNQLFSAANPQIQFNAGGPIIKLPSANTLAFLSDSTNERMRITSSTTGGLILAGRSASVSANATLGIDTASGVAGIVSETGPTSAIDHIRFFNGNGNVGNITTNGGATAYNTSSDYRLKENVVDIADGITRVKQLSPKRFNFIVDADTTVDGFLAHEAQTVVPEAVTGTHDEVDSDGNPEYQGIDPSKLVPLLTAALQEAITKIETLETKVAALEAG